MTSSLLYISVCYLLYVYHHTHMHMLIYLLCPLASISTFISVGLERHQAERGINTKYINNSEELNQDQLQQVVAAVPLSHSRGSTRAAQYDVSL